MEPERLLAASRQLADRLKPGDLDETLARITAAAVEVLPDVQMASITVKHSDGRLETVAPTHDAILKLDSAQYDLHEGPCYEAAVESVHVIAPNLVADDRFPRYGPTAVAAGVRAQAGIRLFEAQRSNGALNLYSEHVGAFEDLGGLGELFAHQAAIALEYARRVDQLEEAVESRQLIGHAVGIVMERFRLSDAQAFAFLTRLSSAEGIKLRVIAERLLSEANDRQ